MSENTQKKARSIEMVTGSLWKNIILFSIPLMCSQILEVLFNLSDVAVVGRFADYKALGAVGSTTLLVTLFVGFLIGMGSGVNVRVAHALGAGKHKDTVETVHTALLLCMMMGLLIGAVCFFFSGRMLMLLHTKDDLIGQASLYLKIYAIGLPSMGIYNFGNGVLSARGETKRPLYYLAIAGVLNVILNLFFVIVLHMAAAGVATATAIAQYVSAGLILIHLLRRKDECRVSLKDIRFHRHAAISILMLGIPAGIQNAIFAIANLFVQTGVNSFDTVMVSGSTAATNADTLIFNVMYAFYTGCSSFMSQNYGARNKKRVLKSYFISLFYSFTTGLILGLLLFIFGHQFMSLFATDAAVIDAGMQRIKIMAFSYCVSAFMDCTIAASRGLGKTVIDLFAHKRRTACGYYRRPGSTGCHKKSRRTVKRRDRPAVCGIHGCSSRYPDCSPCLHTRASTCPGLDHPASGPGRATQNAF